MPKHKYCTQDSQAHRVIAKFGNARRLAELMTAVKRHYDSDAKPVDPSTVYKWRMPKSEGGTGGLIPSSSMKLVMKAARLEGIVLSAAELSPIGDVV